MDTDRKLQEAIELIESAIVDFGKLAPIIGDAATALAEIYREELKKIV